MLTLDGCRARQRRALERLAGERCDLLLTANYRTVYYLTGVLAPAETPVVFVLRADGSSKLLSPVTCEAAADEVIETPTYFRSTGRSTRRSTTPPRCWETSGGESLRRPAAPSSAPPLPPYSRTD